MLQDIMQSHVDRIIHRPVYSVCKLQGLQQGSGDVLQVGQHQSFKRLHEHRRESNWSVVIKSSDLGFLGTGMIVEHTDF
jgi:hypothetical protein